MAALIPPNFTHPQYELIDKDKIKRRNVPQPSSRAEHVQEEETVLAEVLRYVKESMLTLGFKELWIPDEEAVAKCPYYVTNGWEKSERLLIILTNQVGGHAGIWSRSLCFSHGLRAGSMLECFERGIKEGFAILVLNPNCNSVTLGPEAGENSPKKVRIEDSSSPEEHTLGIWENLVRSSDYRGEIYMFSYGNGSSLVKDILLRNLTYDADSAQNIVSTAMVEASQLAENDDAKDVSSFLKTRFINWEQSEDKSGTQSFGRLGCVSISVGSMGEDDVKNAAWSVQQALDSAFRYFIFSRTLTDGKTRASTFAASESKRLGIQAATSRNMSMAAEEEEAGGITGMFRRMLSGFSGKVKNHDLDAKLKITDFDLLKVVGKGAFGKVMLVRKRSGADKGNTFAMKVLKKSMIIAKGQVEHTNSERSILREIDHPFIVCLRYAFQSDEKLYLVTDYYSGGSLFYHLRKARGFSENRTRFYAAELLLALCHLHENHIIYRDLKLENVLMDHEGHIALTDFGLSKEGVDDVFEMQLSTFCGTAEYIAPELLKGQKYGAAVDWWSYGVLMYEMMGFKTPFFDKNRKLMFYNIINNEPQWQPHFSSTATSVLKGLLMKPPQRRLGSGPTGSAEIKSHPFFASIDWAKLEARDVTPPFQPEVKNILDPKFVPKTYLNEAAHDSFDRNAKVATNVDFDNFTYQPASALDP
mmetsp:Transcript_22774/g.26771  ORF Transcript_22774/g.26771 Transcript_22774/m.26771 type:complete len:700 (-) Transcript_22774:222-2321(-)